jgi:hypothetical protein
LGAEERNKNFMCDSDVVNTRCGMIQLHCRSSLVLLLCVCWYMDEQYMLGREPATIIGVEATSENNVSPELLCMLDEGVTHPTCCCCHVYVMC